MLNRPSGRADAPDRENPRVTGWLRDVAEQTRSPGQLPSAAHLWWKAQLLRELEGRESGARRLPSGPQWIEAASHAVLAAAAVAFVSWNGLILLELLDLVGRG